VDLEYQTREAVKRMFISAQKTVTDLIEDKIKNETNLPLSALLCKLKDKNTFQVTMSFTR
jgi:hypothetical protein